VEADNNNPLVVAEVVAGKILVVAAEVVLR
jgi:hypothetical protein